MNGFSRAALRSAEAFLVQYEEMLLGRGDEAARLTELLDQARRGRSAALILHGDPGIGKTALLEHAIVRADGFTVLRAVPLQAEGELAFAGLSDLVRPVLRFLDRIPSPQRAALSGALALGPAAPGDRFAVAAATLSLLATAGEEAPVLAVVDDAHWLDRASLEALLFAARRLGSESVVLLFGMRDRDWIADSGVEALRLQGLRSEDAAALVDRTGVSVTARVRDRLVNETGGNPLAILEAISTLTEAELSGDAPIAKPLPVGEALERAFAAHLQELPGGTRHALLIAAASESGEAGEITRALEAAGLADDALEPAERDGVITLVGERYAFRHPLVRSAAYHLHDPVERRAAHRALAQALGEGGERAAWHLALATVGPDERVASVLEQFAVGVLARSAYSVAASAFEAAARFSTHDQHRLRRTMGAGRALWLGGEATRAASLLEDAVDLAPDPLTRAEVQQLRGMAMLFTRPIPETRALLETEAARIAAHDPASAAKMLTTAAIASIMAAEMPLSEETARRAVGMAPAGSPEAMFATFTLGLAVANRGRVDEALALVEPLLDLPGLFEEVGENTISVAAICNGFTWLERFAYARRTLGSIVDAARAASAPVVLPFPLAALSELEFREGRMAAAYASAAESVQLATETRQIVEAPYSLVTLARVEAVLGREEECRARVTAALSSSRSTGANSIEVYAGAALGLLELSLGRPERAVAHFAVCNRLEAEFDVRLPTSVPWRADHVEACVRCGALGDARNALAALEERSAATGVRWGLGTTARCRGMLAEEDGYAAEFEAALGLLEDMWFEQARTQLAFGMRLRRSRRRAAAREMLSHALDYFDRAGAEPWADQARAELRAAGAMPAPVPDGSLRSLTPQELQVAMIVAKGATNKEAAAALFLSQKTVEFHLRNAYRKLNVRSRAELVRRVEGLP